MGCASSKPVPTDVEETSVDNAIEIKPSSSKPHSQTSSKSSTLSGGHTPKHEPVASFQAKVFPGFERNTAIHNFDSDPPIDFQFSQLQEATDNFNEVFVIGEGGFGKVYQGWVQDLKANARRVVAVKKLNPEGLQGFNEWLTEVIFLRRLRHPHLVHLVGYCTEGGEGLLVYEYLPRKSLDTFLFSNDLKKTLSWDQRVKIALGAAKGLAYLHEGTDRQVIFRDLKAGNILLDHDFTAKLSDFGLAKDGPAGDKTHVSTKVVGTYGYTAPEYMQTGHLTSKSDVYAFGVVLLELLSGRRAVDLSKPTEEKSLVVWAKQFLEDKKKLSQFIDPKLNGRYPDKAAQKLAINAHFCLQKDAKSRPSMSDMVRTLETLQQRFEGSGEFSEQGSRKFDENFPSTPGTPSTLRRE